MGVKVRADATGFPPGKRISLTYDDKEITTAIANEKGSFETNFIIPTGTSGEHKVTTEPPSTEYAFTIIPNLLIGPVCGPLGAEVEANATGFPQNNRISLRYDDKEVTTAIADEEGDLQTTFDIPPSTLGNHQITTEPASNEHTFTITPKLIVAPNEATVDTKVTIAGTGFSPGTISVRYDADQVSTTVVDDKGNFQATFKIPPSAAGEHRITTDIDSSVETFTVIPKLTISPASGHVGTLKILPLPDFIQEASLFFMMKRKYAQWLPIIKGASRQPLLSLPAPVISTG